MAVDLLALELVGVIVAVAFNFGGIHFESLSHLSFLLAGLADLGDVGLGGFTHLDVSGVLDGSDGHCHELVGGGVAVGVVVVIFFLGFMTTLLGQDKFGGLFALYLGAVVVGVLSFCSEELFRSTLL